MGHMQPQVEKRQWVIVTSRHDTIMVPKEHAGVIEISEDDVVQDYDGWAARLSAPGYMDATDWHPYPSEVEAWTALISDYPEAFAWHYDETTVHYRAPTVEAARAMRDYVQSVDGSCIEADGEFLYTMPNSIRTAAKELEDHGFDVVEDA